jgi:hypothetical protein
MSAVIETYTADIKALVGRTAYNVVLIGEKLIEVKKLLEHGEWETWLKDNFDWTASTAVRMMQVARRLKSRTVQDLPIATGALYLLAEKSTPTAFVETVIDVAKEGTLITQSKAKQMLATYKEGHPTPSEAESQQAAPQPVTTDTAQLEDTPEAHETEPDTPAPPSPPATPTADAEAPVLLDAVDNDKAVLPEANTQVTPDVREQTEGMVPPSAPQDGAGRVSMPEPMASSAKTVVSPGPATPHPSPSAPALSPDFDPSAFVTLLRTMKAFPDPATLVPDIPSMFAPRIDLYLAGALAWLRKFNEEWKSHTLI